MRFAAWSEDFLAATTGPGRGALLAQGEALAVERRRALAELIQKDPRRALELAVPGRVRRGLPATIARHLEEEVSGRGDFEVVIADDFERRKSTVIREVVLNGRRYTAFVYGRGLERTTQRDVPLHGIAVGEVMAVDERTPPAGKSGDR